MKAEQARDEKRKVKDVTDCLGTEQSWRLSENFERSCIEKNERVILNFEQEEDLMNHSLGSFDVIGSKELRGEVTQRKKEFEFR